MISFYHVSDAIIGECVDQIGDTRAHPPTKRNRWGSHGWRLDGYGYDGDYSEYEVEVLGPSKIVYGGNDKPLLSCGARVVIETESDINILK